MVEHDKQRHKSRRRSNSSPLPSASRPAPGASVRQRIANLTETNLQLKRKIFDLYTVFEISRNLNSVLNYDTLLDTYIFTCLAQVSASKAAIFLSRDGSPDRFALSMKKGAGSFPSGDEFFEAKSKLTTYLTRLNRPIPTDELIADIANSNESEILKHFSPGLIVPLIYQARCAGLFAISDKMSGRAFQMEDVEFLSILGNQISVAIENARLYEAEKKATEQLRNTQQQLVHSERLAALGEMSAKIAHEVNNPLGIIKNYNLLVKRAISDNVEARGYAEIVGQEIDRIARIVKELLEFHRPRGISFQKIQITNVVEDILHLMERKMEKQQIRLIRKFAPGLPKVEGSPENLKQVFINLVINATDVMPDGGTLIVETSQEGDQVVLNFCDTGPGIEASLVGKIFDPFFTTKEPGKGTGLGLSVCYGIIKKHKGSITYRNKDNGGCFQIKLPAVTEDRKHDYTI